MPKRLTPMVLAVGMGLAGLLVATPASAHTPPLKPPRPPASFVATPRSPNAVQVNWLPPASNGGAPITGYTATISEGGVVDATCKTTGTSCFLGGLGTIYYINGLKRGNKATLYRLAVVATNEVGNSKPAKVSSTTANPADPICSYVGPYAFLSTACAITDWSGLDLQQAWLLEVNDLAGVNLSNTNLEDAVLPFTLAGANLTGANVFHAGIGETNLTGVTWSNTTCPDGTNSDSDGGTCINNLKYSLNGSSS
jgi:hypothetical protein